MVASQNDAAPQVRPASNSSWASGSGSTAAGGGEEQQGLSLEPLPGSRHV